MLCCGRRSAAQILDDSEDSALVVCLREQTELGEDAAHVRFDGADAERQPTCDAGVRQALRHERENLLFPWRQVAQAMGSLRAADQQADHFRVYRCAAAGDAAYRGDELVYRGHPILQT